MKVAWSSFWDGRSRAALRIGLAVIAALEFLGQSANVASMSVDRAHFESTGAIARALEGAPFVAWVVYALILAGLALVALDKKPIAGGAWALAWMSFLSAWQTDLFGSPSRNSFFPGAALFGWVLGLAWAKAAAGDDGVAPLGRAYRERLAEAGALGCLAAAYVGSATSKLLAAGLSWVNTAQVRALVLWQHPVADWAWLHAYRDAILEDATVARIAAAATLIIEGGAFCLLLGARLRLLWAALIVGLHVNIILLCTMPYVEPMVLLGLLAVPWPAVFGRPRIDDPLRAARPEVDLATVPKSMRWVLAGVLIAGWLLMPLGWRAP